MYVCVVYKVKHNSRLFYKYNENLDRESAYELLNDKIEKVKSIKEELQKETKTSKTTTRRSTVQNPIIKVLTSATFIRAAFGILKKVLK